MPQISVIVPVYNVEQLMQKCIASILGQTFTDFELILVDDGSTDNSGILCDRYGKEDMRVRVFHQKNRGASAARNTGIDAAQGRYIAFIDSDDFVPADYLEQLLVTAGERYDLAICPCLRPQHADKQADEDFCVDFDNPSPAEKEKFNKLFVSYILHGPCSKLYRRDIIEENGIRFPVEIKQGEDCVFVFSYLRYCKALRFRSKPVYFYYENQGSMTHQVRKDRFTNGLAVNTVYINCIDEKLFMTDEIRQVWARATFKDAYHGIEDIFSGVNGLSFGDLLRQVDAIMKHPSLRRAMKIARISGYNKVLVFLMKHKQTFLYCMVRYLSEVKEGLLGR